MALQAKRPRVDFIDVDAADHAGGGVEIIVVINAVMFGIDPLAFRMQIGLRRLALNHGSKLILAAVGVGHPEIIEGEKSRAQAERSNENRHGEAMRADAAGLEGRNFVVLAENREHHQDRCEHADRRKIVNQARRQPEMILEDRVEPDTIADDIAQELKKFEDVKDAANVTTTHEIKQETSEHIAIDDLRNQRKPAQQYFCLLAIESALCALLRRI